MTVAQAERSLPLRVAITDGEAFDSWIEALARRNGMPVAALLPALGFAPGALYAHHALLAGTPAPVLRRIERQSGLEPGRLDAAVLEHYDRIGWPKMTGTRFCPACLADTDGRWQLRWRLPWIFACQRHRLMLVDTCPGCGLTPRRRQAGATGLHPAASCPNLIRRGQTCATDLRAVTALPLPAGDQLLATQSWISAHLDTLDADGPDADTAAGAEVSDTLTTLNDLNAIGQWRRLQSRAEDYRPFGPQAVEAFTQYYARGQHRPHPRHPLHHAFTDGLLVGAVATFARGLLTATSAPDILTDLRPLTMPLPGSFQSRYRQQTTRFGNYYQWKTLSPAAQARFLTALDAELAPADRLRYRSCSPTPRLPQPTSGITERRARHVPQLLWADWAVRFTPNHPCGHPDALRAALAVCLLMPGTFDRNQSTLAAHLHERHAVRHRMGSVILGRLVEQCGTGVLIALCRVADYLDEHGVPIDYQRRRALITADLLTEQQWKDLCRDTMTHPGKGEERGGPARRLQVARRYMFQLLTGADLSSPAHKLAYRDSADRNRHLNAVQTMSTPLRDALHRHAADRLARLGIDEPLTWSPPASLAAGLELPGREPDDINLDRLHHMVIVQHHSLRAAAREMGTTLAHVRHAVEQLQRDPGPWAARTEQARHQRERRRRELLTREFFEREVTRAGKSRSTLRDETGIPIKELTRYANQVGVSLIGHRLVHIDSDWLAEQYLTRRRSFSGIAEELGLDADTVAHHARRYGIPSRVPGVQSHPDLITTLDPTLPQDIRRAVEGQLHGWQRLRRFKQVMAFPSMNAAAAQIDADLSALILQFNRLEHDVGAHLFHRSTPTTPQRLTPRGARLLDALEDPRVRELLERHGHPPRKSVTRKRLKKTTSH